MKTKFYFLSLAKVQQLRIPLKHRKASKIVQSLFSGILLVYLASKLKWQHLIQLIAETNSNLLVIAPVFLLLAFLFAAARWHYILKDMNIHRRVEQLYAYYLIGLFYGIFLPGAIGGDIVRVAICNSEKEKALLKITNSVIVERICGITALFFMGSFAIILLLPQSTLSLLGNSLVTSVKYVSILLILVLIGFLFFKTYLKGKLNPEHNSEEIQNRFLNLFSSLKQLTPSTIFVTLAFSGLLQSFDIIASFIIAKAFGIFVSLPLFFAIMPVVYIATILPISLGGLGVREGVFVFLLTKVNVLTSDAVALSFMVYINRVLVGMLGGVIHLLRARSVKLIHKA